MFRGSQPLYSTRRASRVQNRVWLDLLYASPLKHALIIYRFIHWLQDVPDQAAILRQYCRYSGEVKSGRNIKEMVNRALELALSDPKGPSYLTAAREVLEEVSSFRYSAGHQNNIMFSREWTENG